MRTTLFVVSLLVGMGCSSKAGVTTAPSLAPRTDTPDRDALIGLVKRHAQNPADLEIVELGRRVQERDGPGYTRKFVIHCALVGHTPESESFGGDKIRQGN